MILVPVASGMKFSVTSCFCPHPTIVPGLPPWPEARIFSRIGHRRSLQTEALETRIAWLKELAVFHGTTSAEIGDEKRVSLQCRIGPRRARKRVCRVDLRAVGGDFVEDIERGVVTAPGDGQVLPPCAAVRYAISAERNGTHDGNLTGRRVQRRTSLKYFGRYGRDGTRKQRLVEWRRDIRVEFLSIDGLGVCDGGRQ